MGKNDFVPEGYGSATAGFISRHFKAICAVAIAAVVIIGAVFLALSLVRSKRQREVERSYDVFLPYYSLTADSSQDDISNALAKLDESSQKFSAKSPLAVRLEFYKADLYERLGDAASRIEALRKVADNASKDSYLLEIALYNLAMAYEDASDLPAAAECYERICDTYGEDSELSAVSLFSLYRIFLQSDPERAMAYKARLENDFADSGYAKFLLGLK